MNKNYSFFFIFLFLSYGYDTFNMTMFKGRCHQIKLIYIYQTCLEFAQGIVLKGPFYFRDMYKSPPNSQINIFNCFYFKENLALGKPAHQDHQYWHMSWLTGASHGVDGQKSNLSFFSGQCVISANEKQTATWWVNLTSILSIHHITIYYRTENVAWGQYRNIVQS